MTFDLNKKFRFREFRVYRDARTFNASLKRTAAVSFPKEELFGLRSQLWRALDSILLNIAEGSERGTDKDFAHFLNTAHTSLNEVVACLDVALDSGYFSPAQHQEFLVQAGELANQLSAFRFTVLSKVKGQRSKVSPGFTLFEMLVVISLSIVIMMVLLRFTVAGFSLSRETRLQQQAVEDARVQLKRIGRAIRESQTADTGAYPLVDMQPQRIIFFSDVDADNVTERIRYELSGTNLLRGVIKPSGTPLTYDVDDEVVSTVARSVRNGADPLFTYYTGDYPTDQTPLTPVDLTEVKYVQFYLRVDADPNVDPAAIDVLSQVQLRNLKTNLGETVEE